MTSTFTRAMAVATAFLVSAALPALVLPAAALGAGHIYRSPATVDAEVHLRGTNGFDFIAFAIGDTQIVSASRRVSKLGEESVNYYAHGSPDALRDGVLRMEFGMQGHFRGRFVAMSTETQKVTGGCTGDPMTIEKGFFVGSFNFQGERGYSSVHARRVRGPVTRQGPIRCRIPSEGRGHEGKRARKSADHEFRLIAGDGKSHLVFQASREEPAPLEGETTGFFEVSVTGDKAGAFEVSQNAFTFELPSKATTTFQVPNLTGPPTEAILEPPAPFSGSATFHLDTPKSASWTGDLAVELPGLGKTPLTGAKIAAGLCRSSHCTKTLPGPLQRLLEASRSDGEGFVSVTVETQTIR
jgi:hypothetical protein